MPLSSLILGPRRAALETHGKAAILIRMGTPARPRANSASILFVVLMVFTPFARAMLQAPSPEKRILITEYVTGQLFERGLRSIAPDAIEIQGTYTKTSTLSPDEAAAELARLAGLREHPDLLAAIEHDNLNRADSSTGLQTSVTLSATGDWAFAQDSIPTGVPAAPSSSPRIHRMRSARSGDTCWALTSNGDDPKHLDVIVKGKPFPSFAEYVRFRNHAESDALRWTGVGHWRPTPEQVESIESNGSSWSLRARRNTTTWTIRGVWLMHPTSGLEVPVATFWESVAKEGLTESLTCGGASWLEGVPFPVHRQVEQVDFSGFVTTYQLSPPRVVPVAEFKSMTARPKEGFATIQDYGNIKPEFVDKIDPESYRWSLWTDSVGEAQVPTIHDITHTEAVGLIKSGGMPYRTLGVVVVTAAVLAIVRFFRRKV